MPLNSDGCLVDQTPLSTQSVDIAHHAPPLYGEHLLDQLYADMDQSGLMTPAPQSGMNTPFYAQSRSGSHENLSSSYGADSHQNGAVPPAALSSRLQNLNANSRNSSYRRLHHPDSGGNTPHPAPNDSELGYFDQGSHSGYSSNPLSRRVSEEEDHEFPTIIASGLQTPEHIDYSEMGDLTKVPSYSTAIKTPVRGMSYSNVLPNYSTATSLPPSPVRGFSTPNTPGAPSYSTTNSVNPLSSMGFTPIHQPAPAHTGDLDERRRLHILRHRERSH